MLCLRRPGGRLVLAMLLRRALSQAALQASPACTSQQTRASVVMELTRGLPSRGKHRALGSGARAGARTRRVQPCCGGFWLPVPTHEHCDIDLE